MAVIDTPASQILLPAHITGAMALSVDAGWNQTPDDWALFIDYGRTRGIFIDGELIATAATLNYGTRLGHISMVLVTPRYRNRGIATGILSECIDDLEVRGCAPMLDATPAGALMYRRLGFVEMFHLRRWQGEGCNAPETALRTATPQDAERLIALDFSAFGAARPFLIRDLLSRAGARALISDGSFVVRRKGVRADQIGPLVAANARAAQQLLLAGLGLGGGPVFLDVPDHQQDLTAVLAELKFSVQRPFTRMGRGLCTRPGDPTKLFVVAGPEFG